MTQGTYRPSYHALYRAALDEKNNLIAFHVRAGGIPESPLAANRFPAGAIDHYKAESWDEPSNIIFDPTIWILFVLSTWSKSRRC